MDDKKYILDSDAVFTAMTWADLQPRRVRAIATFPGQWTQYSILLADQAQKPARHVLREIRDSFVEEVTIISARVVEHRDIVVIIEVKPCYRARRPQTSQEDLGYAYE